MFRASCPKCGCDNKTPLPKTLHCERCGEEFLPKKSQLFFKVRCAACGEIVEQPLKNVSQHAPCPICLESSFIPVPPPYQKYLDKKAAEQMAEKKVVEKSHTEKKDRIKAPKEKRSGVISLRKRGRRAKIRAISKSVKQGTETTEAKPSRHAVRKASGHENEEIKYECAFCGAGISQGNIDREEAENHGGRWYCWDHVPK